MHNSPANSNSNSNSRSQFNAVDVDDEVNFSELLNTILDGRWLILIVMLITIFLGVGKILIDDRIYKTDAMLQVQEKSQSVMGIEPLADMFGSKLPVMAEIEIIKSRKVLGTVVNNLDLDLIVKPNFFPYIGKAVTNIFTKLNLDDGIFFHLSGLSKYSWGTEKIKVDTLEVPNELRDKQFNLLTGNQDQFQLFLGNELIIEGEVGKLISKKIENYQQPISLYVSFLKARPGKSFTLERQSSIKAIERLRDNFLVSEKSKNTGILELILLSTDPVWSVKVLNEIADIYVQQNIALKSAESQKTLEFLEKQLPILKTQVEIAAAALNSYKNQHGSVNLDIETQSTLMKVVELKTQITLLQQKRDELRQKYTDSHPNLIAIDKQIARLQSQLQSQDRIIRALPKTQQAILELTSNVQVNSDLYNTLLNNSQTMRVAKEGTVGDVRIIDYAVLRNEAIKPNKFQIISVSFLLGVFLGIFAVFIKKSIFQGLQDPSEIERQFNVPVYATIYHSAYQDYLNKISIIDNKSEKNYRAKILAFSNQEDIAIESLKSFRTAVYFSLLEEQSNLIVISGPRPGIGKSFIALNLAAVIADTGKRILLIDADIRKGNLNVSLGLTREKGLSDLILDTCSVQDATHELPSTNFSFISTGTFQHNPSELLLHTNFSRLLDNLRRQYDLIVIDSAPILAVTDAAIIARHASMVFLVIKSGLHSKREVEQTIKKFTQVGVHIKGFLINDLQVSPHKYGYGYSYGKYHYQYNYKKYK